MKTKAELDYERYEYSPAGDLDGFLMARDAKQRYGPADMKRAQRNARYDDASRVMLDAKLAEARKSGKPEDLQAVYAEIGMYNVSEGELKNTPKEDSSGVDKKLDKMMEAIAVLAASLAPKDPK